MTTRSSNIVTIKHPAQSVHAALTTEEYWAHVAATLSPEPGEVHEFVPTDGGAEITLYEVLPLEILPEAVRSMISSDIKIKRECDDQSGARSQAGSHGGAVDGGNRCVVVHC